MATVDRTSTPNVGGVLRESKGMQDTNQQMTKGMQKINLQNMIQQGQNNMFNAGVQTLSQAAASARDVFSAIGRNM